MIDVILGLTVAAILAGAVYGIAKQLKQGGCAGCSSCSCKDKSNCPSNKES